MVRFELEKKRIGIRIVFDRPKPIIENGLEICLFAPKGTKWYHYLLPIPYKYVMDLKKK